MFRPAIVVKSLARRCVAAASLAGFLAAIVGLPVVHPFISTTGKDLSRPFPCMHGNCGCQSAEGCWRGCCCHTNRQKLAWAKAHGVRPPEYVATQAAKESPPDDAPGSCCVAATSATCCQTAGTCESADSEPLQWQLLPALAARKCHGLPQLWLLLSTATPTAPKFQWLPAQLESGRIALVSDFSVSQPPPPDTPPPRA
jgi:hypothetical protein